MRALLAFALILALASALSFQTSEVEIRIEKTQQCSSETASVGYITIRKPTCWVELAIKLTNERELKVDEAILLLAVPKPLELPSSCSYSDALLSCKFKNLEKGESAQTTLSFLEVPEDLELRVIVLPIQARFAYQSSARYGSNASVALLSTNNEPLADVRVRVSTPRGSYERTTNASGEFLVVFDGYGRYTYEVASPEYYAEPAATIVEKPAPVFDSFAEKTKPAKRELPLHILALAAIAVILAIAAFVVKRLFDTSEPEHEEPKPIEPHSLVEELKKE